MDYLGRWFWVCNGEKTTVKAVGQDGAQGEPGKDAQPEVKRKRQVVFVERYRI